MEVEGLRRERRKERMGKGLKLRMCRGILSCRSKDPSTLPLNPLPSFHLTPPSSLHRHRPSFSRHVSSTFPNPSPQFKWQKDDKWLVIAKVYQQPPRLKTPYAAGLPHPPLPPSQKRRSKKKKRTPRRRNSTSSPPDSGPFSDDGEATTLVSSTSVGFSTDYSSEFNPQLNTILETPVPRRPTVAAKRFDSEMTKSVTSVRFSTDSSPELNYQQKTLHETPISRRLKKKKRSIEAKRFESKTGKTFPPSGGRNRAEIISRPGEWSPEMESPARLSVFKKMIPCAVEGKVRESFAVVKRSEDPYEDFRRSMMDMILEKHMFDPMDLEQLLQCFLSLNSPHHHAVIVEAFSEIWDALFCQRFG